MFCTYCIGCIVKGWVLIKGWYYLRNPYLGISRKSLDKGETTRAIKYNPAPAGTSGGGNRGIWHSSAWMGGSEFPQQTVSRDVSGHHTPDEACKFPCHSCNRHVFLLPMADHLIVFTAKSGIRFVSIRNNFS